MPPPGPRSPASARAVGRRPGSRMSLACPRVRGGPASRRPPSQPAGRDRVPASSRTSSLSPATSLSWWLSSRPSPRGCGPACTARAHRRHRHNRPVGTNRPGRPRPERHRASSGRPCCARTVEGHIRRPRRSAAPRTDLGVPTGRRRASGRPMRHRSPQLGEPAAPESLMPQGIWAFAKHEMQRPYVHGRPGEAARGHRTPYTTTVLVVSARPPVSDLGTVCH